MRCLKDGLIYHVHAIKAGIKPAIFTLNQLVHLYSKHGLLPEARKLFDEMTERNVFSWNAIISAHIRSRDLAQARALFDAASQRDLVTYNSMLAGYASADGCENDAIQFFMGMQRCREGIKIDEFTVTTMLNLCSRLLMVRYGTQLHCFMVKTGNDLSGFGVSSLVDLYSKCGCFKEVTRMFDNVREGIVDAVSKNAMVAACCRQGDMEMALKLFCTDPELNDTVSWNTIIWGYVQNGYEKEALRLFVSMADKGFRWNEHTFATVLSACSSLRNLQLGKEVHALVLKNGLYSNPFISSSIVDVYCKCGNMKYAESVHVAYGVGNSFSITSMIVGYSSEVNMVEARRVFDSLSEKNSVVWTAMFSGYVKSQQCDAVFELLDEFRTKEAMVPDASIVISLLGACVLQAALDPGKQIHAYILRSGVELGKKLMSGVVDMYSKCGNIEYAEKVFGEVTERDTIIYNVIIAGYAHHGQDVEAIQLFEQMLDKGFEPDEATFVAILSACRHRGLVEIGEKYFNSMSEDYNILPEADHYACMIDLYGRANQLEKAVAFMKASPMEEDAVILGAFLNACKLNRNAELAKEAEEKLLRLEGYNGARYVQLANVYAAEGNWAEMGRIRKQMRRKDIRKFAGCSWVYVDNGVHVFTSNDRSHLRAEFTYSMLVLLIAELHENPVYSFAEDESQRT